jgi:hypothetical protein
MKPMPGRPQTTEAAPYYSRYIDLVAGDNILDTLKNQLDETTDFLHSISEAESLHRYAPDKWSIRQVLNHVNDTERVFAYRAFWFARGFESALPGYDQDLSVRASAADKVSWAHEVAEFRYIRMTTLALYESLPEAAWLREGIASDYKFTVRALAYIIAGHVAHHVNIIKERYR